MAFSTLNAVNEILQLLLLPTVTSATLNSSRESQIVQTWLTKQIDYNLSLGWSFNTIEKEHIPNGAGEIILDETIYRFNDLFKRDIYARVDNKLFDTNRNSFTFDDSIRLRTIEKMDIGNTPTWFQKLVISDTAWTLRSILGGSVENIQPHLQENLVRAKALAVQADIEAGGINYRNRPRANRGGFGYRVRDGYYL